MNNILKTSALSLSAALVLGMSGCSDTTTDTSDATDSTVSGKAVDGYLIYSTVCLDLSNDGFCQIGEEPVTSTDINGSFTLTVTTEQKTHAGYATAPLLVYGGYDSDTNSDFIGKLKAPFDETQPQINITPITTMVEAMVAQGDTITAAENAVKNMLGLPDTADLGADPIQEAETNSTLLVSALQLQKSLEIYASSLKDVNTSKSQNDLLEDLYESLAFALQEQQTTNSDSNLTVILGKVADNHDDLDDSDHDNATELTNKVEYIIKSDYEEDDSIDTEVIGTKIGAIQKEIELHVIDGNSTLDELDFDDITSKDFKLLYAEEILDMVDYEGSDSAFDALAEKIATILENAGMQNSFLPIADEIAALKGSTEADVMTIGLQYEAKMNGFEDDADDLDSFVNAQTIAWDAPMTVYNFDYDENDAIGYRVNSLLEDGVLEESLMVYNPTTKVFEAKSEDYSQMTLVDGNWTQESNTSAYTLSSDSTELSVNDVNIKLIQKIDLATQADEDLFDEIKDVFEDVLGDRFEEIHDDESSQYVSFSSGAEAYVLAFKGEESYRLSSTPLTYSSDVNTTYSSLQSFIEAKTGTSLIYGYDDDHGISFNLPDGGVSIDINATGTMSNMATWEVRYIPNTTELAIFIKENTYSYDDSHEEIFFTLYNGAVHQGEYFKASSKYEISDNLEFNDIALNDIVNAIASANTIDSSTIAP